MKIRYIVYTGLLSIILVYNTMHSMQLSSKTVIKCTAGIGTAGACAYNFSSDAIEKRKEDFKISIIQNPRLHNSLQSINKTVEDVLYTNVRGYKTFYPLLDRCIGINNTYINTPILIGLLDTHSKSLYNVVEPLINVQQQKIKDEVINDLYDKAGNALIVGLPVASILIALTLKPIAHTPKALTYAFGNVVMSTSVASAALINGTTALIDHNKEFIIDRVLEKIEQNQPLINNEARIILSNSLQTTKTLLKENGSPAHILIKESPLEKSSHIPYPENEIKKLIAHVYNSFQKNSNGYGHFLSRHLIGQKLNTHLILDVKKEDENLVKELISSSNLPQLEPATAVFLNQICKNITKQTIRKVFNEHSDKNSIHTSDTQLHII